MNKNAATVVLLCLLIVFAGCSASRQPTESDSASGTTTLFSDDNITSNSPTTQDPISNKRKYTENQNNTETSASNQSSDYTEQFKNILKNDSVDIDLSNAEYNSSYYTENNTNITSIRIKKLGTGNQHVLVISQNLNDFTKSKFRKSIGKIGIAFATILKREATNQEGDWRVSQARILTHERGELKVKNRIELAWANGWAFNVLNWSTEGYVENRIIATSAIYNKKKGEFNRKFARLLEAKLEIASVGTNISDVHVNQSGSVLFLSYVTNTPPSEKHMADHIGEYMKIINSYAELQQSGRIQRYDQTTLYINEIYKTSVNNYDMIRTYRVDSQFAEKVYMGKISARSLSRQLIKNVFIEQNGYFE